MDIQRTGLLAILGILTYVLFVQWNHYTDSDNEAIKLPPQSSLALQKAISPTKSPGT